MKNHNGRTVNGKQQAMVSDSMLLVLPPLFRQSGGELLLEAQAFNGLNRWADHFSKVVAVAAVVPERDALGDKTTAWKATSALDARVECIPLPWAYKPLTFARQYLPVRRLLRDQIARCEFLQFAIGGLWGDWAAVAASEAKRQRRIYAIHTDRVEPQVVRELARRCSGAQRFKLGIVAALMERYHKTLIKNCALGLWHGRECYTTYSKWCTNSHLIHDVHTRKSDAIDPDTLLRKLAAIGTESTLRIAYAGRLSPMKAPLDWVKAVGRARDLGVSMQATWYGDGELREEVVRAIESLQLGTVIRIAGFVSDRDRLLQDLRKSHIFLFTHVTPESPRCLLEALICGMPIVGYNNPFASDLTSDLGGGAFVSIHDWKALGDLIANLAGHRSTLGRLVGEAAENGKRFNDEDLFRERSMLVRSMQAAS